MMGDTAVLKVGLPLPLKNILLKGVCKRINIINYCGMYLGLNLKQAGNGFFKGTCPFCTKANDFYLSKESGKCFCSSCFMEADFFDLVGHKWEFDLSFTFNLLAWEFERIDALLASRPVTSSGGKS